MAWQRIIGDSLADANRQAGEWQRTNLNTQSNNIARQNQAEQYWNSQLAAQDENAWRRQAFEESRRLSAADAQRRQFEWGAGRQDTAEYNKQVLGLEREKIAANLAAQMAKPDQTKVRIDQYQDKRLQEMADAGLLRGEKHVLELSPETPPALAAVYAQQSREVQSEINNEDAAIKAAADELNRYQKLKNEQAALPKPNAWGDWAHGGTPNADLAARAAKLTGDIEMLRPRFKQLTDAKNPISQHLRFDEESNQWIPLIPMRAWHTRPGSTAPSPTWTPPAPPAPPATARPLTIEGAREFLRQANGDKARARELARQAGFAF